MISEVVDSVASLIWACADGNENAMKDLKKAVSEGLICNADDANMALASYIKDMKAKVAELEEHKSKARDANDQWDKFSLEHSIAAQSQVALGNPRAISDMDVGVDVEHMFAAAKKAYASMLDTIAYIADYAAKNHTLMQAFGIEMCFILAHERLTITDMAGIEGNTMVVLGTDKFRHIAAKLILKDAGDTEEDDDDDEEDDVE